MFTAKNVAADISEKLCDSVATKLEGKVLGTFSGKTRSPGLCSLFCLDNF